MGSVGIIEAVATRTGVNALSAITRSARTKRALRKITSDAQAILAADQTERFVEHLNPEQLRRLENFVKSPSFGQLVQQAAVCAIGGYKEDADVSIRSELRSHLKLDRVFSGSDLIQSTDVLHELIYSVVLAVRSSSSGLIDRGQALSIASRVATAAARNSDLLARINSLNSFNAFAWKLGGQARSLHDKLRLPAVLETRAVSHSQLYVEPKLCAENDTMKSITVEDMLPQGLRTVILGDPGAGKSTLASKLVHDLAASDEVQLYSQVPILLSVQDHTQQLRSEHATLLDYLEAACRKSYGIKPPEGALEYLLLNGRATVVIDGLDELGDSNYRSQFTRTIEAFSYLYPLARIVVTSRIVGYHHAPLDENWFRIVKIMPFSSSQVEKYVNLWFQLNKPREVRLLAKSFMHESSEIDDLRCNPLMLSLLCVVYAAEHFIPQNRPEIYGKCAELLFDTWDRSRGIEVPFRYRTFVRPTVQRLAWKLFTDPEGRQVLPRDEMEDFLATDVLGDRFDDPYQAAEVADQFLRFCAGRAWVLSDMGSDVLQPYYGFVHRTFLEYFAASALVRQKPDAEAVWSKLEPHIQDGSWEMVSHLAAQILEHSHDGGADSLIRLAISQSARDDTKSHKNLAFAVRILDSVTPSSAILRDLVQTVTEKACRVPMSWRRLIGRDSLPLLQLADLALHDLLYVRNPDNIDRVARTIAHTIARVARDYPLNTSAAMLFVSLSSPLFLESSACLRTVAEELAAFPIPTPVERLNRLQNRPAAADVVELGPAFLYERWFVFNYCTSPSLAERLLLRCTTDQVWREDGISDEEALLDEVYPAILEAESWSPTLARIDRDEWSLLCGRVELWSLRALSARARACALLLLLPVVSTLETVPCEDDPATLALFTARHEAYRRNLAIETVNELDLPGEAHSRIIRWILGS